MMASFYYDDQNPSKYCFLVQIYLGFCYINRTRTTKLKYERKNEVNSGLRACYMEVGDPR